MLAAAGLHAAAPDLRGFGYSDCPPRVSQYSISSHAADLVGLVRALGHSRCAVVGHDWGASIAWQLCLLHPEIFVRVCSMAVPPYFMNGLGLDKRPPLERTRRRIGAGVFFYQLYHNEFADDLTPGPAEQEYDADPAGYLKRIYLNGASSSLRALERRPPTITDPSRAAGGWLARNAESLGFPAWLPEAEFDDYVAQFRHSGFRGGVNLYRNVDANWRIMARFAGAQILQPALFIGGDVDGAIPSHEAVERTCQRHCADLRGVHFLSDCSHFCAEQSPEECNALLLPFLLEDDTTPPAAARL